MNIITNADVEKFLKLLNAGFKDGIGKDLIIYTSAERYDGTDVVKSFYVSLEFKFRLNPDKVDEMFLDEDVSLSNQINDMLKDL